MAFTSLTLDTNKIKKGFMKQNYKEESSAVADYEENDGCSIDYILFFGGYFY